MPPGGNTTSSLFFNIGLGYNNSDPIFKSLAELMKMNGHNYIDVLKMDVEGAEWEFLEKEKFLLQNVGQLLVEVHFQSLERGKERAMAFLKDIESMGMRLFFKELNHGYPSSCTELSFIQKEWGRWDYKKRQLKLPTTHQDEQQLRYL
eukprot:gene542-581_t